MYTKICQTCLTTGRWMYPVSNLETLIKHVKIHIKIRNLEGLGICWECKAIMEKFSKFKQQVSKSQDILNNKAKIIRSFSNLKECKTDVNLHYNFDDLSYNPVKIEEKYVIQDLPDEGDKPDQSGDDFDHLSNDIPDDKGKIYKHKSKKTMTIRNIFKEEKADGNKCKDKYTTIVFTEEEIFRYREEKRNQPNFKKIPYKCDTCVLGFTREETFMVHMTNKHSETIGTPTCEICEVRFPTQVAKEKHKQHHYIRHRCKLCKYETTRLSVMVAHCRDKHGSDKCGVIRCPQCAFTAGNPEEMAEHQIVEHSLFCNECGEKFKGKHTLRTHKARIHAQNREFICDICHKALKTKSRLESHIVNHNATIAARLAYCAVCQVQYKNIYVYRNHLKNSANHSERSYQCPECQKKFASKVYWQRHCDFYHLRKSQYKCDICDKLFISNWRLKNHRQKHHGLSRSRDHACNVCGKKFYTLSTLRGHQLTHSDLRPYMCEDCGDTFKQRPALYTHTRLVHKGFKRNKKL